LPLGIVGDAGACVGAVVAAPDGASVGAMLGASVGAVLGAVVAAPGVAAIGVCVGAVVAALLHAPRTNTRPRASAATRERRLIDTKFLLVCGGALPAGQHDQSPLGYRCNATIAVDGERGVAGLLTPC
jgi:hypothetical protein